MGLEPTNGSLGSYCLTTWLHPRDVGLILLDGEIFDNPDSIFVFPFYSVLVHSQY